MKETTNMAENTNKVISKGQLAIILSKLEVFPSAKVSFEQYPTDSEIAAEVLWQAYQLGDIEGRTIADLGAGTGTLGLGTMLLGAKEVHFVETDKVALDVAKSNLESLKSESSAQIPVKFHNIDLENFTENVDVVVQNPPFGTKNKHADKPFLEKACAIANVVYSFHKTTTLDFVKRFVDEKNATITHQWRFDFPLKQTMKHHTKKIQRVDVTCVRFVVEKNQ